MVRRIPVDAKQGNTAAATSKTSYAKMRRANMVRWFVIFLIPMVASSVLWVMLSSTPEFYQKRLYIADDEERIRLSTSFFRIISQLGANQQQGGNVNGWFATWQEKEINAWLSEGYEKEYAESKVPQPRIAIEGDHLRLGFRYKWGPISTIVHVGFRAWVPKANVLALEIQSAKAGSVPISSSYVRSALEGLFDENNLEFEWKQNQGKLVAIISLPLAKMDMILRKVEIDTDHVLIRGASRKRGSDFAPGAN